MLSTVPWPKRQEETNQTPYSHGAWNLVGVFICLLACEYILNACHAPGTVVGTVLRSAGGNVGIIWCLIQCQHIINI